MADGKTPIDMSDTSVWKTQFSQDGHEYYVNRSTGQNFKPSRAVLNKSKSLDTMPQHAGHGQLHTEEPEKSPPKYNGTSYIQQYTTDKVPFYVDMTSGVSTWTLPEGAPETAVKYITHLTDQGIPYYEDTMTKTTSWTLPVEKLSTSARRSSMALRKMTRRQSNVFMASGGGAGERETAFEALRDKVIDDDDDYGEYRDRSRVGGGLQNRAPFSTATTTSSGSSRIAGGPGGRGGKRGANTSTTALKTKGKEVGSQGKGKAPINRSITTVVNSSSGRSPGSSSGSGDDHSSSDSGWGSFGSDGGQAISKKPFSTPTQTKQTSTTQSRTVSDVTSNGSGADTGKEREGGGPAQWSNPYSKPLVQIVFEKYDKNHSGCLEVTGYGHIYV